MLIYSIRAVCCFSNMSSIILCVCERARTAGRSVGHVCIRGCVCVCVCAHAWGSECMCAHVWVQVCAWVHVHAFARACVCVCVRGGGGKGAGLLDRLDFWDLPPRGAITNISEKYATSQAVKVEFFLCLPWRFIGGKGQIFTPTCSPPGKDPLLSIEQGAEWVPDPVWIVWSREKYLVLPGMNHDSSVIQSVLWSVITVLSQT